jgi:putative transposase
MRHLNGVVTQAFNRRHRKVGHLLRGRFKAILVGRDAYLLEVCRDVKHNPAARPRVVSAPGRSGHGQAPCDHERGLRPQQALANG